jgi:hypothetical protein
MRTLDPAARQFIPKLPREPFALINIFYFVVDGVGDRLECRTWSIGATPAGALRRWFCRQSTPPKASDYRYEVVTVRKIKDHTYVQPIGERIRSKNDHMAEYLATG